MSETLSLQEEAAAAQAAADDHAQLLVAPVGSVRPADSAEARIERLEALLRSAQGLAVLTPERAVAAAEAQDAAAKDAEPEPDEAKKKAGK